MGMNVDELTMAVLGWRPGIHTTVPRYTPGRWWECDVFEITESGYFNEFEIKVSVADFKRDGKKDGRHDQTKHQAIATGNPHGPSRFWFVIPRELESKILPLMPPWAGLLTGELSTSDWRQQGIIREVIGAPRLHKAKVEDRIRVDVRNNCYHRYKTHLWKSYYRHMAHLSLRAKQASASATAAST